MIKKLVLIIILSSCINLGNTQTSTDISCHRNWNMGMELNASSISYSSPPPNQKEFRFLRYKIAPFAIYYVTKNWGIGILGEYDKLQSTDYLRKDLYGLGIISRYKLDFIDLSKITIYEDLNLDDFLDFFIGIEYRFTNYSLHPDYPFTPLWSSEILYDNFKGRVLKMDLGYSFFIFPSKFFKYLNGLNISFAYRFEFYESEYFVNSFVVRLEYEF